MGKVTGVDLHLKGKEIDLISLQDWDKIDRNTYEIHKIVIIDSKGRRAKITAKHRVPMYFEYIDGE